MSGHPTIRDDPDDAMVRRAATTGHRMAMGPGEPALTEWAAAGLALPDETAMMRYRLDRIVAYPVQDETHWTDGDGRVLPDALLVPRGTTAKGLAYAVHSDLGDGFILALDARSGRVIGAEHELGDDDVIKIVAKT